MKKIIPLLILPLLLGSGLSKAQPVITASSIYAIGDVFTIQYADTAAQEGSGGANQTWDFSGLQSNGAPVTQSIVSAGSTPHAADFPTADFAINANSGDYVYLDVTGSDVFELGVGTPAAIIKYTDPQKYLSYPITYNSTFSDAVTGTWLAGTYDTRAGNVNFIADGYGTLILPSGTVNNVLRMKYVQDIDDQTVIAGNTITTNSFVTTYSWMVPGNKNSLVNISYLSTTTLGISINIKSVYYYPGSVSTNDLHPVNSNVQIFPNPASGKATVIMHLENEGNSTLSLYNISGVQVKQLDDALVSPGLYSREIDLSNLENGVYFLKMDVNNETIFLRRIVKE